MSFLRQALRQAQENLRTGLSEARAKNLHQAGQIMAQHPGDSSASPQNDIKLSLQCT